MHDLTGIDLVIDNFDLRLFQSPLEGLALIPRMVTGS